MDVMWMLKKGPGPFCFPILNLTLGRIGGILYIENEGSVEYGRGNERFSERD